MNKSAQNASNNQRFGDCLFRTYRLALAATGEYTAFHGGTVADALAAQVTAMNRVNGIYERDFSLRMNIIGNNNLIIYTNGSTDPYTNNNGSTMLNENQSNLDAVIGLANYDIGHVFSTGGGGIAQLNSPCGSGRARGVTGLGSPINDPFYIDYVAHELGHQWGGSHTFNNCAGSGNGSSGVEVGSGVTIQAYAGICGATNVQSNSDAMFHAYSLEDMYGFITGTGNGCAVSVATLNNFPNIISNTSAQAIPKGTPFMLTCNATDADGDSTLTYSWEQMDWLSSVSTAPPVATASGGPVFRTFLPTSNPTRYFPRLQDLVNNTSPTWEVIPTVSRTLNFRLIVRDNYAGAGCNDHVDITLTVSGSAGPFDVTYPNASGITWNGLTSETVTWNVAGTDVSPVNCTAVDILLSIDGGLTYTDTLATSVPNTGSYAVTVPNTPTTTARIMVVGSGRAFFDISNNNFTIVQGSQNLTCFGSATNISCNGASDGIAAVQALGGTAPYTYLWSNSVTTEINSNIAAGTYTVTILDAVGADTTCFITVTEPAAISVSSAITDVTCGGYSDGSAVLTVTGGTQITTAITDTLFTENFESGLATGFTHQTLATDGGWLIGTSSALSSANWTVPNHSLIAATNDDGCNCDKGEEYFILPPQNFDSYGSITLSTEIFFLGNTYQGVTELGSIVVSTNSGVSWTTIMSLTGASLWQTVNADLTAYSGMNNVLIAYKYEDGGDWLYGFAVDDIMITAEPANPISYLYQWSNGSTDSLATNLIAGNYTVTVTDANGCSVTHAVVINEPAIINITVSKSNVNCNGGSDGTAAIAASGGTSPYTYSWNTNPVQTAPFINNLPGAFYTATVTDAMGCTKTGMVEIRVPDILIAYSVPNNPDTIGASDGEINLLVTGGIAPYTHLWSNGVTTEDVSNMSAGTYFCTTTDRNGCAVLTITSLFDPPLFAPFGNVNKSVLTDENNLLVYPNPVSDLLIIEFRDELVEKYSLKIYATTGQLVHESFFSSDNKSKIIDMTDIHPGIYILNLKSRNTVKSFRINKL